MLLKLPDDLKVNPKAFYKCVKAVGGINKSGVLVEEIIEDKGLDTERIIAVEKGLEEMIKETYCTRYKEEQYRNA